jgi:hypothetical protein
MTGFPQAMNGNPPPEHEDVDQRDQHGSDEIEVREGVERHAAVARGRVVTQQIGHDGVAPFVEGDARDEHDEDDQPVADEEGSISMRGYFPARLPDLVDQLLLLRRQGRIGDRVEDLRACSVLPM